MCEDCPYALCPNGIKAYSMHATSLGPAPELKKMGNPLKNNILAKLICVFGRGNTSHNFDLDFAEFPFSPTI
jgi:hypothetical protein